MKALTDWAFSGVALLVCGFLLAACGGGGGSWSAMPWINPTSITGVTTPPLAPVAAAPVQSASLVPPSNMLLPPNSPSTNFPAITQSMDYTFDSGVLPAMKVVSLAMRAVDPANSYFGITGSPTAFPADAALGQPASVSILAYNGPGLAPGAFTLTQGLLGSQPASILTVLLPGGAGSEVVGYVLPYSLTLNPGGYVYQTFGSWISIPTVFITEGYFSAGVPTAAATLPAAGTASYNGSFAASPVDAATRDPSNGQGTVSAAVNFAARTVTISTAGTTTLSNNAASGVPGTANPALNLSGTLTFVPGSNTFTGAVTTANGMTGNVTGRFYGAGISAVTPTKVFGAPPEIGGTFVVAKSGVGTMQGAFGAK